jgi:predicted RNA-binding protein with PIN domain
MYLIDGYNVLYQTTLETREELIEKINMYCRAKNKQAVIVFDGFAPEDLSNDVVQVRFVGDADQEIIDIMKQNDNPTALKLVTSDKDLLYWAGQNKIATLKADHFSYIIDFEEQQEVTEKENPPIMTDATAKNQLEEFNNFQK